MVSGVAFTSHVAENQAAYAASSQRFQQSLSSQQAKIANQIPHEISESEKASLTEQATRVDNVDANLATSQAPASDSLVGASTYNSLGLVHPVHSGTGRIFSASA